MTDQIHLRSQVRQPARDPELSGMFLVIGLLALFLLLVMLAT